MPAVTVTVFPIDAGRDGTVYGLRNSLGYVAHWPSTVQMYYGLGDISTPGARATFPTPELAAQALRNPKLKLEWWPK